MRLVGIALVLALAACDGARAPSLAPREAEAAVEPDLRPHVGTAYAAFAAAPEMRRYSLTALGLSDPEQARFASDFALARPGAMIEGGGARALVFGGCAPGGCAQGVAVLAIDNTTGEAFVGVRDGDGAVVLAPNDLVEALLRINAPTRRWDDPDGWSEASAPAAAP
jgi:hypothetical protein